MWLGGNWGAMRGQKKDLGILAEMGIEPGTRGVGSRLITNSAILVSVMVESLVWLLDGYMEGFGRIRS